MIYHVHSIEQDLAHKWYARVVISEDEAAFLKFDDLPTMDAIQEAAVNYVASLKQPVEEELTDALTE